MLATTPLTPAVQGQVADLLGPGVILGDIATWADEIRPSRPKTAPWHTVNIPRGRRPATTPHAFGGTGVSPLPSTTDLPVALGPVQGGALFAVKPCAGLSTSWLTFTSHVIADPRGGNYLLVRLFGRQTNLHRL
jgi:hypothetical protein